MDEINIESTYEKVSRIYEVRDLKFNDEEEGIVEGYAAIFNEVTNVGGWFEERINPGAITTDCLKDVAFLVNHDFKKLALARSRNNNPDSTLYLEVDDKGLKFRANLDIKNNTEAKNTYSALKRGDVDGMSFTFIIKRQEWDDLDKDLPQRTILEFKQIFEISPVNWPQYQGTEVYARQHSESLESDKSALESVRSQLLGSKTNEFELAREKALFEMQD
jgi:HK97 family phage prohead protease